jgi:hypothetical protein
MGKSEQFLTQIDQLRQSLKKLNLTLKIPPTSEMNNYSTTDLVLAVREEASAKSRVSKLSVNKKPASKLINAWTAGVPAIVSPDPSYLDIKKSDLDFLIAKSENEIIDQIKKLKRNPSLRLKMIKNGNQRALEFNRLAICNQWKSKFENEIVPKFFKWNRSSLYRLSFRVSRSIMFPQKLLK